MEGVQREVEMGNGGCFATSEASKDQENLDADGHTKQSKKNVEKCSQRLNDRKKGEREREREKRLMLLLWLLLLCVEKVIALSLCAL